MKVVIFGHLCQASHGSISDLASGGSLEGIRGCDKWQHSWRSILLLRMAMLGGFPPDYSGKDPGGQKRLLNRARWACLRTRSLVLTKLAQMRVERPRLSKRRRTAINHCQAALNQGIVRSLVRPPRKSRSTITRLTK